jgi:hypothetical protein
VKDYIGYLNFNPITRCINSNAETQKYLKKNKATYLLKNSKLQTIKVVN